MGTKVTGVQDPTSSWVAGSVQCNHWQRVPWAEKIVMGVTGDVMVVSSKDAVGFTIEGGDHANWIALVRGPSGMVHAIPGCKVQSITFGQVAESSEYATVP